MFSNFIRVYMYKKGISKLCYPTLQNNAPPKTTYFSQHQAFSTNCFVESLLQQKPYLLKISNIVTLNAKSFEGTNRLDWYQALVSKNTDYTCSAKRYQNLPKHRASG